MHYFIYVSGTKVKNLFAQIPKTHWPSIAAEVGFNVGLFSAKVSSDFDPNGNEEDHQKLLAVVRYLKDNAPVGSIDAPNVWVADEAEAKIVLLEEGKQVVVFSGITAAGTTFALGGSTAHALGQTPSPNFRIGWSFLPHLLQALKMYDHVLERDGLDTPSLNAFINDSTQSEQQEWMDLIQTVQEHAKAPHIRVAFLAKRLLSGTHPYNSKHGLLATPIYVQQLN